MTNKLKTQEEILELSLEEKDAYFEYITNTAKNEMDIMSLVNKKKYHYFEDMDVLFEEIINDVKTDKKLNSIGLPKYRDIYLSEMSILGYHAINWLQVYKTETCEKIALIKLCPK